MKDYNEDNSTYSYERSKLERKIRNALNVMFGKTKTVETQSEDRKRFLMCLT